MWKSHLNLTTSIIKNKTKNAFSHTKKTSWSLSFAGNISNSTYKFFSLCIGNHVKLEIRLFVIFGAARIFFGPSYFVTTLKVALSQKVVEKFTAPKSIPNPYPEKKV